jgi:hypothetical protein
LDLGKQRKAIHNAMGLMVEEIGNRENELAGSGDIFGQREEPRFIRNLGFQKETFYTPDQLAMIPTSNTSSHTSLTVYFIINIRHQNTDRGLFILVSVRYSSRRPLDKRI